MTKHCTGADGSCLFHAQPFALSLVHYFAFTLIHVILIRCFLNPKCNANKVLLCLPVQKSRKSRKKCRLAWSRAALTLCSLTYTNKMALIIKSDTQWCIVCFCSWTDNTNNSDWTYFQINDTNQSKSDCTLCEWPECKELYQQVWSLKTNYLWAWNSEADLQRNCSE